MSWKARFLKDTDCVCRKSASMGERCNFCEGARCFSPKILFPDSNSKPPFVDVVPIAFLDNTHVSFSTDIVLITDLQQPTIASGASQNVDLQLATMPAEIRAKIYPYLLIKSQHNGPASTANQSQVHVTANDKSVCRCPQGVHCQHSDVWSSPTAPGRCSAIGPPGVISILRVCKQLYEEAVSVLYGRNIFVIDDILKFQKFFVDHPQRGIGSANCRLIKLVSIDPDKIMDLVYTDCFQWLNIEDSDSDCDSASTMSEWEDVDDTEEDTDED